MPDPEDDLRSTAESIVRDAERVRSLEQHKASLEPTDPRVRGLSAQIERLAMSLQGKAAAERELTDEIASGG